jgi:hypothetical protein
MDQSPTTRRSRLHRRAALTSLGAGGIGIALAASARPAAAQEGASDLAGHPLTGTWAVMTPGGVVPQIHGPDGSVIAAFPPNYVDPTLGLTFQGPALGRWESTGARSGHFTVIQALSDTDGTYLGTFQFEAHPEVSADGESFINRTPQRVIVRDAHNTVTFDQVLPSDPPVSATRVGATMESVVLPATTPAATPTS